MTGYAHLRPASQNKGLQPRHPPPTGRPATTILLTPSFATRYSFPFFRAIPAIMVAQRAPAVT